jgi:hypothetical protein
VLLENSASEDDHRSLLVERPDLLGIHLPDAMNLSRGRTAKRRDRDPNQQEPFQHISPFGGVRQE